MDTLLPVQQLTHSGLCKVQITEPETTSQTDRRTDDGLINSSHELNLFISNHCLKSDLQTCCLSWDAPISRFLSSRDAKRDFCARGTKSPIRDFASLYNRRAISLWIDKRILNESKLIGIFPQTAESVGMEQRTGLMI